MNILFTEHAKIRCLQRKIPQEWVELNLAQVPLSPGKHERRLEGTRLIVIYEDLTEIRNVITLYPVPTTKNLAQVKASKHAKMPQVKDMVTKVVGKSRRRSKPSKVKKFKKR